MICVLIIVSQVKGSTPLNYLGQVSGGSAFRTYYKDGKLYAGVGTSLWVYDATDVTVQRIVAKRDFRSLIMDIKVRDDGVIFVAANHDGLWALDGNYSSLPTLAHLEMGGDTVAVDLTFVPPDTLLLTDYFSVRILQFTGNGFDEIDRFAYGNPTGSYPTGSAKKGNKIVVTKRHITTSSTYGLIELYESGIPPSLMDTLRIDNIWNVNGAVFSDRSDSIVYILGGYSDTLMTKGELYVINVSGFSLDTIAHKTFTIDSNLAGVFAASIIDLSVHNDTLFVVTTASVIPGTLTTDCPVVDATQLPALPVIAHIRPGLWYFDISLLDNDNKLDTIAIASEWYGLRWMDVSSIYSGDTLIDDSDTIRQFATGGWGKNLHIYGDTLWLAWEGYGVGIFDITAHDNPVPIGRLPGPFATDVVVLDTLAFVARSSNKIHAYNLNPWYSGGEPQDLGSIGHYHISRLTSLLTNVGPRIAYQSVFVLGLIIIPVGMYIFDPTSSGFPEKGHFLTQDFVAEMIGSQDTLFVAHNTKVGLLKKELLLSAYLVHDDNLDTLAEVIIDTANSWKNMFLARESNLFAVGIPDFGVFTYVFLGDSFSYINNWVPPDTLDEIKAVGINDGKIYVSLGVSGLFVLDGPYTLNPVFYFKGSGGAGAPRVFSDYGLTFIGGLDHVDFAENGDIFVSDFHAGAFVLESLSSTHVAGDVNGDGVVNALDIEYLSNFLFYSGPPPTPYEHGDVNGDCEVTGEDVTYLARFLFQGGNAPVLCVKKR